ncbi:aromatic ring-hydroxylating oxygenase subunit alpha [Sphingosinithalassobacter portus]|uniref:aromatic ring-hydroxylating oxygenase subunit alpha n=1 Tax=Stakelama portus TaxID=2676234 RepID=UPI000D6E6FFE|nr:aromatic ring-hydroxylating dioxygenase subunit alpha [Sphingosinithalassobacter portus]
MGKHFSPDNRPRFGISINELNDSQIDAIRRIPAHDAAVPPVIEERRPASIFLDQERYDLEQSRIFRRLPVPLAPSAMIPEAGSVMAHDGYGVPLMITRDREGAVHVFYNTCTHKGAILVEGCKAQKAGRVTCPYHAWTYGLDGRLIGVPRQETLARFDKKDRPLTELPSRESGGLIWAILNSDAPADFGILDDQIASDFDHFGLPGAHLYGHRRFELQANWKLVMEPFLEGYHVQRLHINSIGPAGLDMFADVVSVPDRLGLHLRQTSGRGNYSPEILNDPSVNIRSYVTHAYNLFPNTVFITSPYYMSVMIIMPTGVGTSSVDYYMLTDAAPDNPKAEDLYARSFSVIQDVFGNEDFKAAETCQRGLSTGAIKDVIYCGMEAPIPAFYEGIERMLGAADTPAAAAVSAA